MKIFGHHDPSPYVVILAAIGFLGLLAVDVSAQGGLSRGMMVRSLDPPTNDDCENAVDLTAPGAPCEDLTGETGECTVTFSNIGATTDGPDAYCAVSSDIWYKLYIGGPDLRCAGSR